MSRGRENEGAERQRGRSGKKDRRKRLSRGGSGDEEDGVSGEVGKNRR